VHELAVSICLPSIKLYSFFFDYIVYQWLLDFQVVVLGFSSIFFLKSNTVILLDCQLTENKKTTSWPAFGLVVNALHLSTTTPYVSQHCCEWSWNQIFCKSDFGFKMCKHFIFWKQRFKCMIWCMRQNCGGWENLVLAIVPFISPDKTVDLPSKWFFSFHFYPVHT
jgi:hypothetical protein